MWESKFVTCWHVSSQRLSPSVILAQTCSSALGMATRLPDKCVCLNVTHALHMQLTPKQFLPLHSLGDSCTQPSKQKPGILSLPHPLHSVIKPKTWHFHHPVPV